MNENDNIKYEEANPNPEYLIKSIAEQGYRLETALADLMDNSISAGADKIEVIIEMDNEPFTLFLADNGRGMDEETLRKSMRFPSQSLEDIRDLNDLGRFGLGMKTASFSQTRRFTTVSRKKGSNEFSARTWDVDYLKHEKKWKLIVNTQEEIRSYLEIYSKLSEDHLGKFDDFQANTVIIWQGLYKFEKYLDANNRKEALKKEITNITSDHLSLVFHRFLEREGIPLKIRINNQQIAPFNPFPTKEKDFRPIEYKQRKFRSDKIKIEGFILPARSIDECRKGNTLWVTKYKGLMDMEGIYIYRADRIIFFGGWNGMIKKAPRLQLARLRVEVGNRIDHLLHLNVSKSQIVVPHDLKNAFERYIEEMKIEAEREYFNRGIKSFLNNKKNDGAQLFERKATNKGFMLELNPEFPLLKELKHELSCKQLSMFKIILKMVNTIINKIRHMHEEVSFIGVEENDGLTHDDLKKGILELKQAGVNVKHIKDKILPDIGYKQDSLPDTIKDLLK